MKIAEKEKFEQANVFGTGAPNTGFAQYFSGDSYLNPLTGAGKCPVFLANVTFEPGCRNNWHIHHAKSGGGQHGAKKDSWFSHIAVEVPGEETKNEWCEPVSDADYNAL